MKTTRATAIAVVASSGLLVASAIGDPPSRHLAFSLAQPQIDVLSVMDKVPEQEEIEGAFGDTPVEGLVDVAQGESEADPGVRLRAYRALALYPGNATAHAELVAAIGRYAAPATSIEVLYLRAAIEALGVSGEPQDVDVLVPMLDFEASRDIRAATADALRELGAAAAIDPLRDRYAREQTAQVRLAISQALRELGQVP
jgi:HEAT repeat protein